MSTAFQIGHHGVNFIGKNQDVNYAGTYLFTNHRGTQKSALMMPPAKPCCWISKYGSITISQIGKEHPNGGMNEAGLGVEQTTLWQSQFPSADDRPAIGELQWIQYLLDTCSTVQEALKAAEAVRIDQSTSKLHYLLADRSGDWAIVEFVAGEMLIHGNDEALPLIANTEYRETIGAMRSGIATDLHADEYERNSMERVAVVARGLKVGADEAPTADSVYELLAAARREDTVYSLVYDLQLRELYVKLNGNQKPVLLRLDDYNFAGDAPALAANVQQLRTDGSDGAGQLEVYHTAFNYAAVASFFRDPVLTSVFQWSITDEMLHYFAHYPDTFVKVQESQQNGESL